MCVIVIAADPDWESIEVFDNASHVCPDFIAKNIILEEWSPVFDAENNVVEQLLVGRHGRSFAKLGVSILFHDNKWSSSLGCDMRLGQSGVRKSLCRPPAFGVWVGLDRGLTATAGIVSASGLGFGVGLDRGLTATAGFVSASGLEMRHRPEAETGTAGGVSHRIAVTKQNKAGGRHNFNHCFPIIARPLALVVPPS